MSCVWSFLASGELQIDGRSVHSEVSTGSGSLAVKIDGMMPWVLRGSPVQSEAAVQ